MEQERMQRMMDALVRMARNVRRRPEGAEKLTQGQLRVMRRIALGEEKSLSVLAMEIGVRPSSLTEMMDKLEARGLVTRSRWEADQRVMRVKLTEAGQKVAQEAENLRAGASINDILTESEKETLTMLCNKLSDGMEARLGQPVMRRHSGRRL
ncbi:MAG: MarR family transcriptional regulator [Clostridia bacterium]|nr:MarR family transcriptional regulator [Clostridia bacterium]